MASDLDHDLFSSASTVCPFSSVREVQAPDLSPDELIKLLIKDKLIVTQFKAPYEDYQVVTEIKLYSRFCDYISRVLYKGKEIDLYSINVTDNSAVENLTRKKSSYNYKNAQSFDALDEEERTALLKKVVDLHIRKCAFVSEFLADIEKVNSKHNTKKRIVIALVLLFILLTGGGIYLWLFYSKTGSLTPVASDGIPTTPIPIPAPPKPAAPSVPDTAPAPKTEPASPLPNDLKCKLYPNEEDCKKR